jgi:hypothetical protein
MRNFFRPSAPKVAAGLTASTTQTQGQGAVSASPGQLVVIAQVSTCANANDTITLPSTVVGRTVYVINDGANTLRVFPASGGNLGGGANTATTVAAGAAATFVCFADLKWKKTS